MTEREIILLKQAMIELGVLHDPAEDEVGDWALNMNDTWAWATAWAEEVPEDQRERVCSLFLRYGACGMYYWVSERYSQMRSEFEDINRMVEFVREEERIVQEEPNSSKRAYLKREYVVGRAR